MALNPAETDKSACTAVQRNKYYHNTHYFCAIWWLISNPAESFQKPKLSTVSAKLHKLQTHIIYNIMCVLILLTKETY